MSHHGCSGLLFNNVDCWNAQQITMLLDNNLWVLISSCLVSVRWRTWRASSAPRWPTTSCWCPLWASSACGRTRPAAKAASASSSQPTKSVSRSRNLHSHTCCLDVYCKMIHLLRGTVKALLIRPPLRDSDTDDKIKQACSVVLAIKGRWKHIDRVYGQLYRVQFVGKVLSEVSI